MPAPPGTSIIRQHSAPGNKHTAPTLTQVTSRGLMQEFTCILQITARLDNLYFGTGSIGLF